MINMSIDAKIIYEQASELYLLRNRVKELEESNLDIYKMLVGIGGPLNDNILEFNIEQRRFLTKLLNKLVLKEEND